MICLSCNWFPTINCRPRRLGRPPTCVLGRPRCLQCQYGGPLSAVVAMHIRRAVSVRCAYIAAYTRTTIFARYHGAWPDRRHIVVGTLKLSAPALSDAPSLDPAARVRLRLCIAPRRPSARPHRKPLIARTSLAHRSPRTRTRACARGRAPAPSRDRACASRSPQSSSRAVEQSSRRAATAARSASGRPVFAASR